MTREKAALEIATAVTQQFETWKVMEAVFAGQPADGVPSAGVARPLLTTAVYKKALEVLDRQFGEVD